MWVQETVFEERIMKAVRGLEKKNRFSSTLMLMAELVEVLQTHQTYQWAPRRQRTAEKRASKSLFQNVPVKPFIWHQPIPLNKKASLVLMSKSGN